jgi:hypothetical protein
MVTLTEAASNIQQFEHGTLGSRIASLEGRFQGADKPTCEALCAALTISGTLLESAFELKRAAGQINVIIHTLGILLSLPYILQSNETVEQLSLGAGNTGKLFDLTTNQRVAEFKFIQWKGGPESARKKELFKDFYWLAEAVTPKRKYLYVVGLEHPLKFLNSGTALASLMSRNNTLALNFQRHYGERFIKVRDYYAYRKSSVELVDLTKVTPYFRSNLIASNEDNDSEVEEASDL